MKKVLLLSGLIGLTATSFAQVSLTGTSYTQNFNSIGGGLPAGWGVYSASTATSLGALETLAQSATTGVYNDTSCGATNVSSRGFKNYASGNVTNQGTPCATQQVATDRALGVRQIGNTSTPKPNLDSGAAFVINLANTSHRHNFMLTFKLQSLDTSSPRTTKWIVDYGVGAAPSTFTPVTTSPASLVTGNHIFSNTTVTATMPTAMDDKTTPVYIRVVTLEPSTGSGNRASTAIDDFGLTWTGDPTSVTNVNEAAMVPFQVLGDATTSKINFSYDAPEAGQYSLVICDMTGRVVYKNTMNVDGGVHVFGVNDANLSAGMHIARITNGKSVATAKVMVH